MSSSDVPWRRLFDAIPVPVSIVDVHGRQVASNEAYAEFLGYAHDDVLSIDVGRITRDEDGAWTQTYLMRLIRGEVDTFESDKVYVRRDGTTVDGHLRAVAVRDPDGLVEYLVGVITPTMADDRPSVAPSVTRRLLQLTEESITLIDANGYVVETRGSSVPLYGYPTSYWKGRNVRDVFPPGEWERLVAEAGDLFTTPGATLNTEVEIQAGDGSIVTVTARIVNCLDDPNLNGFVLVSRDVTGERANLTEQSRRRRTAESVLDAQQHLLATVSHELRNPLHALRGLAELLAEEPLEPKAASLAASLVRQTGALAGVTQDLLEAARMDAGDLIVEATATRLADLVDDVVQLGRAAAGDRLITIERDLDPDLPEWIEVDGARLRQVLTNLVGNAVKFTEDGGVRLEARRQQPSELVLAVSDTGIGIPADDLGSVTEPFKIASNSTEERGAGLGLSIVQRLVSAMNGRLEMSSRIGVGTRVEVVLPLVIASGPMFGRGAELRESLKVLVVEDDPVNQQLAVSQLERLGALASVAGSGEVALEMLVAGQFDAVLMDHQLPGISGIEATRRIRASDSSFASIPVIGLSASASEADRRRFLEAGMNDFVAKPASIDDLHSSLAAATSDASADPRVEDAVARSEQHWEMTIDAATLETLASELGSTDTVVMLVKTFLAELGGRVDAILGAPDTVTSGRAAHTLKSSARLLGAAPLAGLCANIEKDGDGIDELSGVADIARGGLEAWLANVADRTGETARGGG